MPPSFDRPQPSAAKPNPFEAGLEKSRQNARKDASFEAARAAELASPTPKEAPLAPFNKDHNPFSNPSQLPPVPKTPTKPADEEIIEGEFIGEGPLQTTDEFFAQNVALSEIQPNDPISVLNGTNRYIDNFLKEPRNDTALEKEHELKAGSLNMLRGKYGFERPEILKVLQKHIKRGAAAVRGSGSSELLELKKIQEEFSGLLFDHFGEKK